MVVGLSLASSTGVSGTEEASLSALTKLEQILPTKLRNRVSALRTFATRVPPDQQGPATDAATLTMLAAACRNHEKVRIAYQNHTGASSRRIVEPHHMVTWGRRWYLVAWDEDRADWRTFRVDRIESPQPTGLLFTPRPLPEDDISAYIARNVSRAAWKYQARFLIQAPASEVLTHINPAVGSVEPIDEHSCTLHAGADSLWTIAVYIGALGMDFTVLDPPELTELLRTIAARYLRATE
jgi:predicted DNA-binding transcriptional regulator YafY